MKNLNYIFPFFIVERLKTSVSFYVDKLGFETRYMGPDENPYWAIVGRDNISIMLKEIAPGIKLSLIIRGTNGRPGMPIFRLLTPIHYLRNIVQTV